MKTKLAIAVVALCAIVASAALIRASSTSVKGVIVHHSTETQSFWGIETDFDWRRPLAQRRFRLSDLETPFQREGLRVRCECEIYDVIGTGAWDVVVKPRHMELAQ